MQEMQERAKLNSSQVLIYFVGAHNKCYHSGWHIVGLDNALYMEKSFRMEKVLTK